MSSGEPSNISIEKLLESYKTLSYLGTQIFFFKEVHETFMRHEESVNQIQFEGHYANIPFAKAISGNHLNYLILLANAYMDEYHQHFSVIKHPEYADRIMALKVTTKPVIKRIAQWTHLKDYRNYILAHNFRIGDQSLFAKDFGGIHFKVPHTNSEVVLLAELLRLINIAIAVHFPELLQDIYHTEPPLGKMSFEWNEVDVGKEITELWTKMGLPVVDPGIVEND